MAFKMKGPSLYKSSPMKQEKKETKLKDLRPNDKNVDLDRGENMPVKKSGFGPRKAFGGSKNPELIKKR